MEFNLSSYFNGFDVDKEYSVDIDDVDAKLESVTNLLAENPESINYNPELLEDLLELIHGFKKLDARQQKQVSYLITSSFHAIGRQCLTASEQEDFIEYVDNYKMVLEKYGYLMFVLLKFLSKEDSPKAHVSGRTKISENSEAGLKWSANCVQVEDSLVAISTVLKNDLSKLFITTPERDLYLELFIRPIVNLMESHERLKVISIKVLIFKVIALSVKFHGQTNVIQHSIIQCLTYYVHLPNYMAELLHYLDQQYSYPLLTEEVLREISQTQFNSNDTNGPKAISEFLIKLSELSPRLILKQISYISQLLDNSNQTLRCSVVETCGNIVVDIIKRESDLNSSSDEFNGFHQIEGLLDLLQERFLDQNPYVRTKAFQALTKICSLQVRLSARRQVLMGLCVRSLDDKSTLVRRNSIKLMSKLVLTHQFTTSNGSQLSYTYWKKQLDEAEAELTKYLPLSPQKKNKHDDEDEDEYEGNKMDIDEVDDGNSNNINDANGNDDDENNVSDDSSVDHDEINASIIEQERNLPETNILYRAKLQATFFRDAIDFIEMIQAGTDIVMKLLFSKNRNEALESMDFLVLADAYGIENAAKGIRQMLHLVWMKGTSDEGKSVPSHLIDCYKDLFLVAPSNLSGVEQAVYIAKNLIGLTVSASVTDLASLEKLLGLMYLENLISQEVIKVLWQIFGYIDQNNSNSQFSRTQRCGAIIILGMLALADNKISLKGIDSLLNIGLNEEDLTISRYTCIALQRVVPNVSKQNQTTLFKLPKEAEVVEKLVQVSLAYNKDPEWYGVAEQAIGAIYQISSAPEVVCTNIIKQKSIDVFKKSQEGQLQLIGLSQLLFLVGHVAIKTIVHLEKLEADFKKKKHEAESRKSDQNNENENDNELEMIGGTSEDDFTDVVIQVRERELLYGEKSLLARFGPLVREICANNNSYNNPTLQRCAVLCLVKLMCVSSIYCEENLLLLLVIMQNSPDPIIRCNCVLGLGDMAVCFNNLIDESTDYLYSRLTDDSLMVQRTCLMTVTFLILAGQVKVKGQLSSMSKCLENPDQGISDMCRLFFTELATKDNAIYNGFIDIFSGLSNDETLTKDSMKRIIRFLLSFIEKEKQQKQLSEKLLVRLSKCENESQWNDIAFVLNTIPYKSESITQALDEGYKMALARE